MKPGDRYGHWTVIDTGPNPRMNAMIDAQCECGTRKFVRRDKLEYEKSKSCGCQRHNINRGKRWPKLAPRRDSEVQPGSRHGRWTALTIPYRDPEARDRVAQVKCDCGTVKTVVANSLTSPTGTQSCGCLARDAAKARHKDPQ